MGKQNTIYLQYWLLELSYIATHLFSILRSACHAGNEFGQSRIRQDGAVGWPLWACRWKIPHTVCIWLGLFALALEASSQKSNGNQSGFALQPIPWSFALSKGGSLLLLRCCIGRHLSPCVTIRSIQGSAAGLITQANWSILSPFFLIRTLLACLLLVRLGRLAFSVNRSSSSFSPHSHQTAC